MFATVQHSLFEKPRPAPPAPEVFQLRPYQVAAVEAIEARLKEDRSTLLVLATGLGKTACFAEVIRRHAPGRCLVLAHRDELIQQAARRIQQQTGLSVAIDKASEYASREAKIVVASVQTLTQDSRLNRFGTEAFALVVADEAHHYIAPSYRKILDYFAGAKVLGVTATPDRGDRMAMGDVFDSVAYVHDIEDGIKGGWLANIRAVTVRLDEVDLSGVRTTAGDLNAADLDEKMAVEEVIHGVAQQTVEHAGDRKTLIFTTGVSTAHRTAAAINGYKPDSAAAIDGTMETLARRRLLTDYSAGKYQFLVNVGVLTEGYDEPSISCVAIARPTKSRSLYVQQVGRGTRIHPGKADLLVIDFAGNVGKHRLVTAVDILGGKHSEEVTDAAKAIIERNPGMEAKAALIEAEAEVARTKEEAKQRAASAKKVKATSRFVDPFAVLDIECPTDRWAGQFGVKLASEKQVAFLETKLKKIPRDLTVRGASALIDAIIKRQTQGLCTYPMAALLRKSGFNSNVSFAKAREIIGALSDHKWHLPDHVRARLQPPSREPGSDDDT